MAAVAGRGQSREQLGPMDIADIGPAVPRRWGAFGHWLGGTLLRLLGWRITGEFPNVPKLIVIGAPHTSNFDAVVGLGAMLFLNIRLHCMVKDVAFKGPWGPLFKWLGGLPIDRSKHTGMVEQTIEAFERSDKLVMVITAEGTRKAAEKWKTGFYHAAVGARVPVMCAVLNYTRRELTLAPAPPLSGDLARDWPQILQLYRDSVPRRPERLSRPICELQGKQWRPWKP